MNQYLVLQEIGHGTHGQVRLGRDMSVELPPEEEGDLGLGLHNNAYYVSDSRVTALTIRRSRSSIVIPGRSGLRVSAVRKDFWVVVTAGRCSMKTSEQLSGALIRSELWTARIRKEIAIFKKVNHPNVVRMREIIDDPISSKVFMVLEYCEGGEIIWKGKDGLAALTVDESRRIFRDTLLGLEYCESRISSGQI